MAKKKVAMVQVPEETYAEIHEGLMQFIESHAKTLEETLDLLVPMLIGMRYNLHINNIMLAPEERANKNDE